MTDDESSLFDAARRDDPEAVLRLLRAGTNPNPGSRYFRYSLPWASVPASGGNYATAYACGARSRPAVTTLRPRSGRLRIAPTMTGRRSEPALYTPSAATGPGPFATPAAHPRRRLLRTTGLRVHSPWPAAVASRWTLQTPLHTAARNGSPQAAYVLLAAGAEVNAEDRASGTTLIEAVAYGHNAATVRALLAAGADPDIADREGQTTLSIALERRDDEMVGLLVRAIRSRIPGLRPADDEATTAEILAIRDRVPGRVPARDAVPAADGEWLPEDDFDETRMQARSAVRCPLPIF